MSKEREFKFYPQDFDDPKARVLHMDLRFDIYDNEVHAVSNQKMQALESFEKISLDADDVVIQEVECDEQEIKWEQDKKANKVHITFTTPIQKGNEFNITIKNMINPTPNILEGLYYDHTCEGCPPQMITQCQQWGFRRLIPTLDEMTTKCTYVTTITANKKYTNVITNGDQVEPPKDIGDGRVEVQYDNTLTPMATYLFFLGVGTWDTYRREFEYPDGKKFTLEVLCPIGSEKDAAIHALDILHNSIMWIHLFTGPNKHENMKAAKEIWDLIKQRETLKQLGQDYSSIKKEIKELAQDKTWGYKYTGSAYREIAMQNSNFGGMENVGNTTITANRMLPSKDLTDGGYEYLTEVKAHEFYHNLNGSEVTGHSPFDIWLNEAVTVHVELENHAFNFGDDYSRLGRVQGILAPARGTLAMDSGPASMPIQPDGFNSPDDMITGITYVKAPEFVRMIQTLMGDKQFVKGLDLYHTKFKHSNAKSIEWIKAMEEKSGLQLQNMAKGWLTQMNYPTVKAKTNYDNGKITLHLNQTQEKGEWEFPYVWAVFDKEGKKVFEETEWVQDKEVSYTYECREPGFVSLNRGMSFYGKNEYNNSREELILQIKHDDDIVAKWLAYRELAEREKIRMLEEGSNSQVSSEFLELYHELFMNTDLITRAGTQFLAIYEGVEDERFKYKYQLLYENKEKIIKSLANNYKQDFLDRYNECSKFEAQGKYITKEVAMIKNRSMQNLCLSILSKLDTPDIHALIKSQLDSPAATNRVLAFRLYLDSCAKDRLEVLKSEEEKAKNSLVRWETFMHVVSSSDAPDAIENMKYVENLPEFDINQSNEQRGIYLVFATNYKRSLLTQDGRAFLRESLLKLCTLNEFNTMHILKCLQDIDKLDEEHWIPLIQILKDVLEKVSEDQPMVLNGATRIMKAQEKALKKWEESN